MQQVTQLFRLTEMQLKNTQLYVKPWHVVCCKNQPNMSSGQLLTNQLVVSQFKDKCLTVNLPLIIATNTIKKIQRQRVY